MTKPRNYILNTEYATLKNDNKGTVSVNITTTGILAYGSSVTFQNYIDIGTSNAQVRCQIYRSGAPSDIWCANSILVPVNITVYYGGTPVDNFTYNLPVTIERISNTRIRIYGVFYSYGAGVSMQISGGAQTVTADIVTFLSPFN